MTDETQNDGMPEEELPEEIVAVDDDESINETYDNEGLDEFDEESERKGFNIWWMVAGLAVMLVVGGLIVGGILLFGNQGDFVTLDSSTPSTTHPDGLSIGLLDSTSSAKVEIKSLPREVFLNNEGGKSWQAARDALPGSVNPLSPIYTLTSKGNGQVFGEMAIPNGAEPLELLDLYLWNADTGAWEFLPSTVDTARHVITFQPSTSPMNIIAAHTNPQQPSVGVVIRPNGTDLGVDYGTTILGGLAIDANGQFVGEPTTGSGTTVLFLVENRQGGVTNYSNTAQSATVIGIVATYLPPYDGIVLDFDIGTGYPAFLAELAPQVRTHNKRLEVVLRAEDLPFVNLAEIAPYVDRIWIAPGDNPTMYLAQGGVDTLLGDAVGQVSRNQLGLWVGSLNVDVSGGNTLTLSDEAALGLFGEVEAIPGYIDPNAPVESGAVVPFRLSGQVSSMGYDPELGVNYLTYHDNGGGLHYLYFSSAQSLNNKLSWARFYGLGSVAVYGLDQQSPLANGIAAYLNEQPLAAPSPLSITWQIASESGQPIGEASGALELIQYVWEAIEPGRYLVSAAISGQSGTNSRGGVALEVAEAMTAVPTPSPTPTTAPQPTADPNATEVPPPPPEQPDVSGGVVPGGFELGGQTHSFESVEQMRYAGMTWVKFQHKWSPGDDAPGALGARIADAHAKGFKVLISIPGGLNPTSIDFPAYIQFLEGVARLGPDGIEIWNEMNLSIEWPVGQISGESYVTNMLAPAYTAIKGVNPAILVISGAPAPTGFFGGCQPQGCDDWFYLQQMRDAGAANYMDCMGVHFNSGATSPTATTGHPADGGDQHYSWYYGGMINLYAGTLGKPLCLTEIGFVSGEGYGQLPGGWSWANSVTVAQHAQWLAEAAVLASQDSRVRLMIIFSVDIFHWGTDPQGGYAIIRPGGGCPACDTLNAVMNP